MAARTGIQWEIRGWPGGTIDRLCGREPMFPELDVPDGFFDDEELAALAELRPEGEPGLVVARRVFRDGRTRA